jgi:carbamoylphosphate synthase large subunit
LAGGDFQMNPRLFFSWRPYDRCVAAICGYTLVELRNEIGGATPTSFEPSIDYVVTKIPRVSLRNR